jgi:cytidylate kinase
MPEDRVSYLQDCLEELFGLHPSQTDLVTRTTHTLLGLAELGNCIIVGRASHIILADAPSVIHIRLVGSLRRRIARVMEDQSLPEPAAARHIEEEDAARARYLHTHFDAVADDPLAYHLVVNTDHFTVEQSAHLIGRAILERCA